MTTYFNTLTKTSGLQLYTYSASTSVSPVTSFLTANGSKGSESNISVSNSLGKVSFNGFSTTYKTLGEIESLAGSASTNNGILKFKTANSGSLFDRIIIDDSGISNFQSNLLALKTGSSLNSIQYRSATIDSISLTGTVIFGESNLALGTNTGSERIALYIDSNRNVFTNYSLNVGTSTSENRINFSGTGNDTGYDNAVIASRTVSGSQSELFLFKGQNPSTNGPDRIRLEAAAHLFQVYTSTKSYTPASEGNNVIGFENDGKIRIYGTGSGTNALYLASSVDTSYLKYSTATISSVTNDGPILIGNGTVSLGVNGNLGLQLDSSNNVIHLNSTNLGIGNATEVRLNFNISGDDTGVDSSVIASRVVAGNDSELIIFQGQDASDRIRLQSGIIKLQTFTAPSTYDPTASATDGLTINNNGQVDINTGPLTIGTTNFFTLSPSTNIITHTSSINLAPTTNLTVTVTAGNNFNVNTNKLYVDATTGNVGINTSSVGSFNLTVNGTISSTSYTGTLLTAAQPNITSLGNLTGLTMNGTITSASGTNIVLQTLSGQNLNIQDNTTSSILQILNDSKRVGINLTSSDISDVLSVRSTFAMKGTYNVLASNVISLPAATTTPFQGTFGYRFTVGSDPIIISQLGIFTPTTTRSVAIWTTAGSLVVSSTVSSITGTIDSNTIYYFEITPTRLSANTDYVIGAFYDASETIRLGVTTFESAITYVEGRTNNGATLTFPATTVVTNSYIGPAFKFFINSTTDSSGEYFRINDGYITTNSNPLYFKGSGKNISSTYDIDYKNQISYKNETINSIAINGLSILGNTHVAIGTLGSGYNYPLYVTNSNVNVVGQITLNTNASSGTNNMIITNSGSTSLTSTDFSESIFMGRNILNSYVTDSNSSTSNLVLGHNILSLFNPNGRDFTTSVLIGHNILSTYAYDATLSDNVIIGDNACGSTSLDCRYNVILGSLAASSSAVALFNNTIIGYNAGVTGPALLSSCTLIGERADTNGGTLNYATAIGASAKVTQNYSLILGRIVAADATTTKVGIGNTAPSSIFHVTGNTGVTNVLLVESNAATPFVTITNSGNITLNGVAGSVYSIGAATTTGSITIGGSAQTGNIILGSSSQTNSILIGNGAGATTITIGNTNASTTIPMLGRLLLSYNTSDVIIGPSAGNNTLTGTNLVVIGSSAGAAITSGTTSVYIGSNSGGNITNSTANTAIGYQSLYGANTGTIIGSSIIAIGSQAVRSNTTTAVTPTTIIMIGNTSLGTGFGASTGTISTLIGIGHNVFAGLGGGNTINVLAIGHNTLKSITGQSGRSDNITAVGTNILSNATTLDFARNTLVGYNILTTETSTFTNSSIFGYNILSTHNTGSNSATCIFGYNVLPSYTNTNASNLTIMGANVATGTTSGSIANSTFYGSNIFAANTTNSLTNSTLVGTSILQTYAQTTGTLSNLTLIGYNTASSFNTAVNFSGIVTLGSNIYSGLTTTAVAQSNIVTVGYNALAALTTGDSSSSVFIGSLLADSTTTGSLTNDVFIGYNILTANTTNSITNSTIIGSSTLQTYAKTTGTVSGLTLIGYNNASSFNTAVNFQNITLLGSGIYNSLTTTAVAQSEVVMIGKNIAYALTTGDVSNSVFIGNDVFSTATTASGTTSVVIGNKAALDAASLSKSVIIGYDAFHQGSGTTSASETVAIGYFAGSQNVGAISQCVFIGTNTNTTSFLGITNSVAIGYNAFVGVDNAVILGRSQVGMSVGIGTESPSAMLQLGAATGTAHVGDRFLAYSSSGTLLAQITNANINLGNAAVASTITIGNTTGASAVNVNVGTGNYTLTGAATSNINIGSGLTSGIITIGNTSIASSVSFPRTSNQIVFGNTNTTTISSSAPTASRTHTIPDPGANSDFMFSRINRAIMIYEDFLGTTSPFTSTSTGWTFTVNGGGGTLTFDSAPNTIATEPFLGVVRITTPATNNNNALYMNNIYIHGVSNFTANMEIRFCVTSTATTIFGLIMGWFSTTANTNTATGSGCGLYMPTTTAINIFQAAGAGPAVGTGQTISIGANNWYVASVSCTNAGVVTGSLTNANSDVILTTFGGSVTTNVPATGTLLFPAIITTAGTGTTDISIDYVRYYYTFSSRT